MKTDYLRAAFLEFFQKNKHEIVPSSTLVPINDSTLLFTNSGMVPFKERFLGHESDFYPRFASAQRCLRAGGKHNDLDNVGYTRRHHTFFEMLGNFTVGQYFKREAIQLAWQFLTTVLNLPPEKLWVTVFQTDQESERLWLQEIGIDPDRFSRCGEKDNFWSIGDLGPCGPCTEIFYDHGPSVEGAPPGSPGAAGDRYVEIWNLVFMQYDRDAVGRLSPLPVPCVDTGMGLERIAAVMQGVHDNYDIDLFKELLKELSNLLSVQDTSNQAMRVIVDHVRSAAFLVMDGVLPSNEGRGYVLRRIVRRALRHGYQLGRKQPFFFQLVPALVKLMGAAYPQLIQSQSFIQNVLQQEEQQFSSTLAHGMQVFEQGVAELPAATELPGSLLFKLYDTYGFPPDLVEGLARERGMTIDYAAFELEMSNRRQQSQQASRFSAAAVSQAGLPTGVSQFVGYETLVTTATVTSLSDGEQLVSQLPAQASGIVVLDRSPFYAESGGQVGDTGYLYTDTGSFHVLDTQRAGSTILHYGQLLKGSIQQGDTVRAEVGGARQAIVANHSATHLLHAALRRILGQQVVQKGSLVEADRLRFDFSYAQSLTLEQLQSIERLVNQQIWTPVSVDKQEMSLSEAKASGALALFGEKYADRVRVVRMGDFSAEICGGTHVDHLGEIGFFKITAETAVAAGVRRIEAVTGAAALSTVMQQEMQLAALSKRLKTPSAGLLEKLEQLLDSNRQLEKKAAQLKQQLAQQQALLLSSQVVQIGGVNLLVAELKAQDRSALRYVLDALLANESCDAAVLATVGENAQVSLVAGVLSACLTVFDAKALLMPVAERVGGRAGGRARFAQGGGNQPEHLAAALKAVGEWVQDRCSGPEKER